MMRAVFAAGVRLRPAPKSPVNDRLRFAEAELIAQLQPPDEREREANLRHAVSPLFAAIIEANS